MSFIKILLQLNILLLIWIFALISCTNTKESKFDSAPIKKDSARLLRRNYRHHGNVLRTVTVKNHRRRALKFEFDIASVQEILTKNVSGYAAPDTIGLIFGQESPKKGKTWHCLIYGLKNKQLLESPDPSTGSYSIFDNIARDNKCQRKSKTEADKLRAEYTKPDHILHSLDWNGTRIELEGVMFLASQIQEIIIENHSGNSPDKVVFYFGLQDVRDKGQRWHIVAYGKKGRKLLTSYTTSLASTSTNAVIYNRASIFDKADPYPPR